MEVLTQLQESIEKMPSEESARAIGLILVLGMITLMIYWITRKK